MIQLILLLELMQETAEVPSPLDLDIDCHSLKCFLWRMCWSLMNNCWGGV